MARHYDLRYQKRHPIPGDPVPLVSERLVQEGSQNLPLGIADDTSGDVILSPQFPTVFTCSASPSFAALAPHTSPQESTKTTHDKRKTSDNKSIKYTSILYKLTHSLPGKIVKYICAFVHPHILYSIEIITNTCLTYLDRLVKQNNKLLHTHFI